MDHDWTFRHSLDTERGQPATLSDQEWEEALQQESLASPVEVFSSSIVLNHEAAAAKQCAVCVPLPFSEADVSVEKAAELGKEMMAVEEEDEEENEGEEDDIREEEEEEEGKDDVRSDFAFLENIELTIGNHVCTPEENQFTDLLAW